ncbi:hypothetical protein [Clostridium peptidivorans]|uniref:hypothetical protein n=1 Tax=Clostridium peptidivorans TaxID=100174 RepID=UPI000BE25745|nr:hypothetical protein [Clostridium peptidivorans]
MATFEPSITEIHLYSDDNFINRKISKENFSNIKLYSSNEIKAENISNELDFSFDLKYFDEEKIQSIIGDKINNISKESYEIYFASSKEEFIKLENFKGIIICLKDSYVDGIRTCNIVVKEKEQALSVILSIYYSFNSYHIFPYDLNMIIGYEFNIIIEHIDIHQKDKFNIIVWNYKNIDSNENSKAVFINTKDSSIRQFKGVNSYYYIVEKIDKSNLNNLNSDSVIAINYTEELRE